MSTNFEEIALQIAKKHFGVETLETQALTARISKMLRFGLLRRHFLKQSMKE